MSRRQIGQEALPLVTGARERRSSLDEMAGLIEWEPIERHLDAISAAAKREG